MEIQGIVQSVIYENQINNYRVIAVETTDGVVTCVGTIDMVMEGENVRIEGDFTYHDKYGEQICIHSLTKEGKPTAILIEKYLASGIIPHIGKVTAKRIVERFGENTLEILKNTPSRLLEVEGIGQKTFQKISDALESQSDAQETLFYLQSLGLTIRQAQKIYSKYERETKKTLEQNPYILIEDIHGIGFKIADRIAKKTTLEHDSAFRIKAGFLYYLREEASRNGHTCMPYDTVIQNVSRLLNVPMEAVEEKIMDFSLERSFVVERIDDEKYVYDALYYDAESFVASKIAQILIEKPEDLFHEERELSKMQEKEMEFSEGQIQAVRLAMQEKLSVITGGPGTGKTTIIKNICEIYQRKGLKVLLAAPTGRAAKRLSEQADMEAQTIHRLLGYMPSEDFLIFQHNEEEPLEADLIIVDEASMIDVLLMEHFLRAVDTSTRLVFVGDADQLPSVGAGNILSDLIVSSDISTVKLDKVFRQGEESNIILNAHYINKGQFPVLNQKDKDFFFIEERSSSDISRSIVELCVKRLPDYYHIHSIDQIQILTPMKKTEIGTMELNKKLQDVLNPKTPTREELHKGDMIYREGDKVMQMRNNYKKSYHSIYGQNGEGIFNGDYGKIQTVDPIDESLVVLFDEEREVTYSKEELDQLQPAYAITIHKAQGSEFPVVIIPIGKGPYMLMTRNLIYTAITRAKNLVVLVGSKELLKKMIDNNFVLKRNTNLSQKIEEYSQRYQMLYGMDQEIAD